MKLISIDIGIKNMAYCILSLTSAGLSIDHWAVLNLTTTTTTTTEQNQNTCHCQLKNKRICNKKATFMKSGVYFCDKHARESQWLIEIPAYKKMKMEELRNYASSIIQQNVLSLKRSEIVTYIENNRLLPIKPVKKMSANDEDLISIAKQMTEQFDNIPDINLVDTWIIENQMTAFQPKFGKGGPTGSIRMKVIQGFVAQYGIMKTKGRLINSCVEFVSPKNKLKGLATNSEGSDKEIYKKHKSDSVHIVRQFLEANECFQPQIPILDMYEKKDDISDTLLQAISWLRNNHYIEYDNNYAITIV